MRICLIVAGPYTSASIHAASMPELYIEAPSALSVAITVCSSPSLGTISLFKFGVASSNCTAFSYRARSKVMTVGWFSPTAKLFN